jgi:hypothetical protein
MPEVRSIQVNHGRLGHVTLYLGLTFSMSLKVNEVNTPSFLFWLSRFDLEQVIGGQMLNMSNFHPFKNDATYSLRKRNILIGLIVRY